MLMCLVGTADLCRWELKAGEHQLQGGPFQQHPPGFSLSCLLCLRLSSEDRVSQKTESEDRGLSKDRNTSPASVSLEASSFLPLGRQGFKLAKL